MSNSSLHPAWHSPRRHFLAQNSPVLLSLLILIVMLAVYYVLYHRQLDRLPDQFDLTTLVDNALPLVFVALGQTIVVVTRGLDLSVGGVLSVSVAIAATQMHGGAGGLLGWSIVILVVGAAMGAVNGVLVAYGKLAPI
ncbi:MAG: hypothetical protein ACRDO8_13085, partial [Nocardioidaceae bacterium]